MDANNQRRTCEICNVEVHRASLAKHRRTKSHLQNSQPNMQVNQVNKPVPSLKEITKNKINLPKKELDKEIAKKMLNPYYLSPLYQRYYKTILQSHNINHLNSRVEIVSITDSDKIEKNDINNLVFQFTFSSSNPVDDANIVLSLKLISSNPIIIS